MAPEIIEMTGITTACDLWSVGCTIIELLTGKPPYFDLPQMTALYKIVQDDYPPLPDGITPHLIEFLLTCLKKEPHMRGSATSLLSHPWLKNPKNHLKMVGGMELMEAHQSSGDRDAVLKTVRTYAQLMQETSPQRRYDLSDQDIQDLNQIADQICEEIHEVKPPTKPGGLAGVQEEEDEDWDKELGIAEPPTPGGAGGANSSGQKGALSHLAGRPPKSMSSISPAEAQAQLRALKGRGAGGPLRGVGLQGRQGSGTCQSNAELDEDALEDWGEDEADGSNNISPVPAMGLRQSNKDGDGQFMGPEATLQKFAEGDVTFDDFEVPEKKGGLLGGLFGGSSTVAAKLSQMKLVAPAMEDDEDPFGKDFEADLDEELESGEKAVRDLHAKVGQEVFAKLSSIEGCSKDSDMIQICYDINAQLEGCNDARFYVLSPDHGVVPVFQMLHIGRQAVLPHTMGVLNKLVLDNAKALEYLALVGIIPKVIEFTRRGGGESSVTPLQTEAAKFVRSLCSTSDFTLQMFISCGGLSVLVSLLGQGAMAEDDFTSQRLVRIGVDGILQVFSLQRTRRNDFCRLFLRQGLLPPVMASLSGLLQTAMVRAAEDAAKAATPSPQDATSAPDLENEREITNKRPLSNRFGHREWHWPYLERVVQILVTFSKSDKAVKEGMSLNGVPVGIVAGLNAIFPLHARHPKLPKLAVSLLIAIKNISMEPSTLVHLEEANVITALIPLLSRQGSSCDQDMENQVLQCMFYMCRISRKRQEKAAISGLVPYLQRCIEEESHLKQFALQIMCDLAHASATVRDILWGHNGLPFYVGILADPKDKTWHVATFRSISAWFQLDTERLERDLSEIDLLQHVIALFRTAQQAEFEKVVEELHTMMLKGLRLTRALGESAGFIEEVKERLHYPKAIVGKTLLSMLRIVYKQHSNPRALIREFDLYPSVSKLAKNNTQVLVAEIANQLLQDFDEHGKYGI
ncbi:unnamed protein product [Chrysoparadoxa australica]